MAPLFHSAVSFVALKTRLLSGRWGQILTRFWRCSFRWIASNLDKFNLSTPGSLSVSRMRPTARRPHRYSRFTSRFIRACERYITRAWHLHTSCALLVKNNFLVLDSAEFRLIADVISRFDVHFTNIPAITSCHVEASLTFTGGNI